MGCRNCTEYCQWRTKETEERNARGAGFGFFGLGAPFAGDAVADRLIPFDLAVVRSESASIRRSRGRRERTVLAVRPIRTRDGASPASTVELISLDRSQQTVDWVRTSKHRLRAS